jgi:hypothetical protein
MRSAERVLAERIRNGLTDLDRHCTMCRSRCGGEDPFSVDQRSRDGTGKSTLLMALSRIIEPTSVWRVIEARVLEYCTDW